MSSFLLGSNLILTFILASSLLYRYGNWYRHHVVISVAVLVAWYFSFIIIFVLPIDVSTAVYNQCQNGTEPTSSSIINASSADTNSTVISCIPPWSSPGKDVLTNLWRVVYWSSQCLTWLILPIMQSYTKAGEFTIKGKLKSALRDNLIYYASYLFICGILFAYIVMEPNLIKQLNSWDKIKLVASSASNTWSLFLLTFMLGYGLVAIPRTLYKSSLANHSLNTAYFKVGKLANERNDSEEMLEDALDTFHCASQSVSDPRLVKLLDVIYTQIPVEFRERLKRRRVSPSDTSNSFTELELIKLNRLMKRALCCWHRAETLWVVGVERAIYLEEVELVRRTGLGNNFRSTRNWWNILRWTWICVLQNYCLKVLGVLTGIVSLAVIWSEATFFNKTPVLSLFALFVNLAKVDYNYFLIELIATLTIAYLCICAYYTVFKMRFFNFYYLASGHQTDEYSLIFCGMLLCRLTPPLCLNFLGLIHLDSHVISNVVGETSYTRVMGHLVVLSIISNGFNIYFPMGILVVGLLTWFRVGARLLSWVGFQQFLSEDDEMTTEMISQGSDLVKREKRKKQRQEQSTRWQQNQVDTSTAGSRFGGGGGVRQAGGDEDSDVKLSRDNPNYHSGSSVPVVRHEAPPRDLFDDV